MTSWGEVFVADLASFSPSSDEEEEKVEALKSFPQQRENGHQSLCFTFPHLQSRSNKNDNLLF